jgi:very-short-patch-repair endonuclease
VMPSNLEATLALQIKALRLPAPETEFRFHSTRKWRFDFAWPALRIAAEVEGGTWSGGRHTRGSGFEGDCEKYNAAALAGWTVLRFTRRQITNGDALRMIAAAVATRITVLTRTPVVIA